jgi:hypothetical protein
VSHQQQRVLRRPGRTKNAMYLQTCSLTQRKPVSRGRCVPRHATVHDPISDLPHRTPESERTRRENPVPLNERVLLDRAETKADRGRGPGAEDARADPSRTGRDRT